jgi:hypothetical protein
MLDSIDMGDYRLMLYYKGDISALTLFLQQENGSICFPRKLPLLSSRVGWVAAFWQPNTNCVRWGEPQANPNIFKHSLLIQ